MDKIESLNTPTLLLDRERMHRNLRRMSTHIASLGGKLRPHVKTHKSRQVLQDVMVIGGVSGITVSTLHEAEYFFAAGHRDILYAVIITPDKIARVADLMGQGAQLTVITDSAGMARAAGDRAAELGMTIPVLIELDVDGHRSGVAPDGEELLDVARAVQETDGFALQGVMTHAGGSYGSASLEAIRACAQQERAKSVAAAQRLRKAGFPCDTVSIGSTPTALMTEDLTGVTEIRPGVYTFLDLFQVGLGLAPPEDIVLSVLATVIGHQPDKGWAIVDAGWMAMSRDRGTASQDIDQGYGMVCDLAGKPLPGVIMGDANQEHGILMTRRGQPPLDIARFPLNSRVRILPNHACATASQYNSYQVLEGGTITDEWERTNGW
ncbi:MAG: alanine racemase [Pseudomonadota bacterium]